MAHVLPFLAVGGAKAVAASAATAAASSAVGAGTAFAVPAALSVPGVLSLGSTLTGAVTSIIGGAAQANALKQEAYFQDAAAKQAELEGRRDAVLQLESLNKALAQQMAAIGASGIGFSGSPISNLKASEKRGLFDVELTRAGSDARVAAMRAQAAFTRRQAGQSLLGGFLAAGTDIAGGVFAQKARVKQEQTLLGLR